MKSYQTLQNINTTLYLNLKGEIDIQNRLKNSVPLIHSQISYDFNTLFGYELNLQESHVYVNDQTYRQGASGLILDATISTYENFRLRVECLIDQGRLWIKVIEGKQSPEFKQIVNRIESVQNVEGLTELKEIQ